MDIIQSMNDVIFQQFCYKSFSTNFAIFIRIKMPQFKHTMEGLVEVNNKIHAMKFTNIQSFNQLQNILHRVEICVDTLNLVWSYNFI